MAARICTGSTPMAIIGRYSTSATPGPLKRSVVDRVEDFSVADRAFLARCCLSPELPAFGNRIFSCRDEIKVVLAPAENRAEAVDLGRPRSTHCKRDSLSKRRLLMRFMMFV